MRGGNAISTPHDYGFVLTVSEHVPEMRLKHLHAQVHGLKFPYCELDLECLRIIVGLHEKQSPLYGKEVSMMMRELVKEHKVTVRGTTTGGRIRRWPS